jgi:hypothetical protein
MLFGKSSADREPQSGAASFGCHERFEDLREKFLRDSLAIVPHFDQVAISGHISFELDFESATVRQGVNTIEQQIDQDLMELLGVGCDFARLLGDMAIDLHMRLGGST